MFVSLVVGWGSGRRGAAWPSVRCDGVEVEQVAGEYRVRLGPQELGPRWPGSARRWVDAGAVQDVPDGGGADLVAEAGEFAVDAAVSPGRILGGQTHDQGAEAGGIGGSTRPGRPGGPAAGDQLAVPAQDGGRDDDNIKGGIWQEVIAAHERAAAEGRPFPGKVTLDGKWHAGPNNQTLVAFGRKPSDRNPTGLHGFHRKYLLVIIDECAGVPEELWEAANSLASNARGRVIAVGNPTDPNSHFAEVCKPGSGWEVQKISAYDTPAYTGEPCPDDVLENLVDPSWVEDMKLKGVKDPRYVARVLGEFPKVSSDSLIEAEWIEAAQKRSLPRTRKPTSVSTLPASATTSR